MADLIALIVLCAPTLLLMFIAAKRAIRPATPEPPETPPLRPALTKTMDELRKLR